MPTGFREERKSSDSIGIKLTGFFGVSVVLRPLFAYDRVDENVAVLRRGVWQTPLIGIKLTGFCGISVVLRLLLSHDEVDRGAAARRRGVWRNALWLVTTVDLSIYCDREQGVWRNAL